MTDKATAMLVPVQLTLDCGYGREMVILCMRVSKYPLAGLFM